MSAEIRAHMSSGTNSAWMTQAQYVEVLAGQRMFSSISPAQKHWYQRGWGLALNAHEEAMQRCVDVPPLRAAARLPEILGLDGTTPQERGLENRLGLGEALFRRTSTRHFPGRSITSDALLALLSCSSLGELPSYLALLLVVYQLQDHPSGVYRWHESGLQLLRKEPEDDMRARMRAVMVGQPVALAAGATVIPLLEPGGPLQDPAHTFPQAWVDAGRVWQRMGLVAAERGLRIHQSPAVYDDDLLAVLEVGAGVPLYTMSVG